MKTKLLATVISMMLSMPAMAITSIGDPDCGEWLKDIGSNREHNRSWLLGFLTGLNVYGKSNDALAKTSSSKQIYVWMDSYCQRNPLNKVSDGGQELMIELMNKK